MNGSNVLGWSFIAWGIWKMYRCEQERKILAEHWHTMFRHPGHRVHHAYWHALASGN